MAAVMVALWVVTRDLDRVPKRAAKEAAFRKKAVLCKLQELVVLPQ